jgi:hypothetical protein
MRSHPWARVTLLSSDPLAASDREPLLAVGVEVVETRDRNAWLQKRPHDWTAIVGDASTPTDSEIAP